jgi:hypothetical protein
MLPRNAGPAPPALEIAFLAEMGLGDHAEDFVQQRFYGKLPPDPAPVALAYADYVGMHDERGCRVRIESRATGATLASAFAAFRESRPTRP